MFGTKLRTWMEAHIVRPKKKKDRKKSDKGFDSNCNSPISQGAANRSPALHQVHPVNWPVKNVEGIGRVEATAGKTSYSAPTTTTSSSNCNGGGTGGSINLSSPESAYSTGYSTDGTSPGASFPPEYYINIRTGTHYFESKNKSAARGKRPPEENCLASNASANGTRLEVANSHELNANTKFTIMTRETTHQTNREIRTSAPFEGGVASLNNTPRKHFRQIHEKLQNNNNNINNNNNNGNNNANNNVSSGSSSSNNNHNRREKRREGEYREERRAESYCGPESTRKSLTIPSSIPPPLVASQLLQSPRQRSRIRTNPWLTGNSSGNSSSSTAARLKSRLPVDETMSSSSGLKLTESSGSASDVNMNIREMKLRRECRQESLSAGRSPINENWRTVGGIESRKNKGLGSIGRDASSSSSASSLSQSARSSEDDITLNEMMGKFDESYVYEKETDILSDSDPTDVEDYVHCISDLDTGQDGGDENDPFENDFDYIDNGSFLDLDALEGNFRNTGHCTYLSFTSELTRRGSRLRESFLKRRATRDDNSAYRSTSGRSGSKRQSGRHKKPEEKSSCDKRKKRMSQRRKQIVEKCDDATANLNRVLVERMLLKNSGFNQGSRSVGGTPMCLRRRKNRHDLDSENLENLGNLRLKMGPEVGIGSRMEDRRRISVDSSPRKFAMETRYEESLVKRRSNSISCVSNGSNSRLEARKKTIGKACVLNTFASEIALIEADKEADRKYRELIIEAENILVNMKNTPSPIVPSPSRRIHNGLANKRVELIKNTELNIELALSKSRNSQPELQSGSIKDLEHTSPNRHLARLIERNSSLSRDNNCLAKQEMPNCQENCLLGRQEMGPNSPLIARRRTSTEETPEASPNRSFRPGASTPLRIDDEERSSSSSGACNAFGKLDAAYRIHETSLFNGNDLLAAQKASGILNREESTGPPPFDHPPLINSSSSDSDERVDSRKRAPLLTFRSVDMGPVRESSYYCPQSEPVKRKVYAGSATYGRIQKSLGERHVALRNSDGDTATDDTDDSRRSLRDKVAQLRQEKIGTGDSMLDENLQDPRLFRHHMTLVRRQMLMHTIEGLKRSLEDQSATLKQTCLQDSVARDEMP